MAPTMAPVAVQQSAAALSKLSVEESETREYIFRSKLPDIELSNHKTLPDYSLEKVDENLDRIALIDGPTGKEWTFGETRSLSKKVAAGLHKLGIEKGDVIALLLPNCAEFALCFLGSATRGSIVTTCNPFYTEREIAKQLNACKAKLIVTQASFVDKVRDLGLIIVTVDSPPEGALPISVLFDNEESEAPSVEIDSDEVVCLPFSSGTTGLPKGVMLTHKSLISSVAQQVDGENPNLHFSREDVIICLLPLFHIYSLHSVLLCALRVCCTIVIMPKYTIPQLLEMIQKYKVSLLPVVPPVVLGIAKSPIVENYDLSSVRKIMSGAAPLGKELEEKFQSKFPNAVLGQVLPASFVNATLSASVNFSCSFL
jgi:4-coumarate--CoA ligase